VGSRKETKEIISFIGLLAKWANVDKVINAANALKKEDVSFLSFYIVGNGPDRGRLEQMVKEYDLNNITFTGFVPIDNAYEIMLNQKSVFVCRTCCTFLGIVSTHLIYIVA